MRVDDFFLQLQKKHFALDSIIDKNLVPDSEKGTSIEELFTDEIQTW